MGKLETLTRQIDYAWEDLVYDRCSELHTLLEIDNIDARWLPYQKPLLGFTADLSFDATTEELRRILSLAVPYWNEKPTELGSIENAIRMVTGNRFRVANWFDFRMQEDQTCITEELEDFDPYAIGFLSEKYTGTLGRITEIDQFSFRLTDLTIDFANAHDFRWLLITSDPTRPPNEKLFEIDRLVPETKIGYVTTRLAPHTGYVEYILFGHMEEFLTEVRLVDEGVGTLLIKNETSSFTVGQTAIGSTSGAYGVVTSITSEALGLRSIYGRFIPNETVIDTGGGSATVIKLTDVLNRSLLSFLMGGDTVRPLGERIDVVYINFLDRFETPGDLDQWDVNTDSLVSVPKPGGPCKLLEGARIQSDNPNQTYWEDQVTAWKITPLDTDSALHLTFMGTDASNHYYVLVDYDAKEVELWKVVAGTPTQIGSTVVLTYLKQGVQDVIRVDALTEGSGTRIRVKVNGETEIDALDSAGSFSAGKVGVYALTGDSYLQLVEVNVLPTEIERIGPNP